MEDEECVALAHVTLYTTPCRYETMRDGDDMQKGSDTNMSAIQLQVWTPCGIGTDGIVSEQCGFWTTAAAELHGRLPSQGAHPKLDCRMKGSETQSDCVTGSGGREFYWDGKEGFANGTANSRSGNPGAGTLRG